MFLDFGLASLSCQAEGFCTIFVFRQNCHGVGGMIFTMPMTERYNFYYVNEYIIYSGVKFVSTSLTWWN